MPLNIKDETVHAQARKLAGLTGTSITAAVRDALGARLRQVEKGQGEAKPVRSAAQLLDVAHRVAARAAAGTTGDHEADPVVLAQRLRVHAGEVSCHGDREDGGLRIHGSASRLGHQVRARVLLRFDRGEVLERFARLLVEVRRHGHLQLGEQITAALAGGDAAPLDP